MSKNEILDTLYELKSRDQAALADFSEDSHQKLLKQRIDALDYAICIISNTGWISCNEQLPEKEAHDD